MITILLTYRQQEWRLTIESKRPLFRPLHDEINNAVECFLGDVLSLDLLPVKQCFARQIDIVFSVAQEV